MAGTREYKRKSDGRNEPSQDDDERGGADGRPADVRGWADSTPSGLRDRIDQAGADRIARRERQTQHVTRQSEIVESFDHAQFVAHITDNIKFNRNGDMMITIQVPYQFKHLAMPLTDSFGIPLSFDVEIWVPYKEASDQTDDMGSEL